MESLTITWVRNFYQSKKLHFLGSAVCGGGGYFEFSSLDDQLFNTTSRCFFGVQISAKTPCFFQKHCWKKFAWSQPHYFSQLFLAKKEKKKAKIKTTQASSLLIFLTLQLFLFFVFVKEAFDHVKKCRSVIRPNEGFLKQLSELELDIFGSTTLEEVKSKYKYWGKFNRKCGIGWQETDKHIVIFFFFFLFKHFSGNLFFLKVSFLVNQ